MKSIILLAAAAVLVLGNAIATVPGAAASMRTVSATQLLANR